MPEESGTPNKRMLLTDFDTLDPGRPTPPSPNGPPEFIQLALPSLADLASSLDLDFEDDDLPSLRGAVPPSGGGAPGGEPEREQRGGAVQVLELEAPDTLPLSAGADASNPVPTWNDFINSFTGAPSRTAPVRGADPAPTKNRPPPPPLPHPHADMDDVLSELSKLFVESVSGEPAPVSASADKSVKIEKVEDWYSPPEDNPVKTVERVEDWYEPPVEETKPEPAGPPGKTAPVAGTHGDGTTTTNDLFSDIDLEKAWSERKRGHQRDESSADGHGKDTRFIDVFDNVDIDSRWNDRAGRRQPRATSSSPSAGRGGNRDGENEETVILEPGAGDAIARRMAQLESPVAAPKTPKKRRAPDGGGAAAKPGKSETAVSPFDFIADFDADMDDLPDSGEAVAPPLIDDSSLSTAGTAVDALEAPPMPDIDDEEPDAPAPHGEEAIGADSAPGDVPSEPVGSASPDIEPSGVATETETVETEAESDSALDDLVRLDGMTDDGIADPDEDVSDGPEPAGLTTDDLLDDMDLYEDDANPDVAAPVIDDSAIVRVRAEKAAAAVETDEGEASQPESPPESEPAPEPEAAVVNPADVLANIDDMDFSDDADPEMRAMLDDEPEAEAGEEASGAETLREAEPAKGVRRLLAPVASLARRVLPMRLLGKIQAMIAWRENWWFYCDLLAAIIASASLAVIISYFVWYR